MIFTSALFLFVFLPCVLLIYYCVPFKIKNYFLLFSSLCFYAYGEPKFVFVMMAIIIINYLAAMQIGKAKNKSLQKVYLYSAIALNVGNLCFF